MGSSLVGNPLSCQHTLGFLREAHRMIRGQGNHTLFSQHSRKIRFKWAFEAPSEFEGSVWKGIPPLRGGDPLVSVSTCWAHFPLSRCSAPVGLEAQVSDGSCHSPQNWAVQVLPLSQASPPPPPPPRSLFSLSATFLIPGRSQGRSKEGH